MKRVCRNCNWIYTNVSIDSYLCVNGNSKMLGHLVSLCSDDKCEDFECMYDDEVEDYDDDEESN